MTNEQTTQTSQQASQQPTTNKSHKRLIFWARMGGWFGLNVGVPVGVFASKFGLFNIERTAYDSLGNPIIKESVSLNGWGIVSCLIVGWTLVQILKEVAAAYTGYSLVKQTVQGVTHQIVPLAVAYGVCYFLNSVLTQVMFCLAVLIVCKLGAIPLNPLPKWRYEKNGVEDYRDALSQISQFLKRKENS